MNEKKLETLRDLLAELDPKMGFYLYPEGRCQVFFDKSVPPERIRWSRVSFTVTFKDAVEADMVHAAFDQSYGGAQDQLVYQLVRLDELTNYLKEHEQQRLVQISLGMFDDLVEKLRPHYGDQHH